MQQGFAGETLEIEHVIQKPSDCSGAAPPRQKYAFSDEGGRNECMGILEGKKIGRMVNKVGI